MLIALIGGNLSLSHNFMKLYTRKPIVYENNTSFMKLPFLLFFFNDDARRWEQYVREPIARDQFNCDT